MRVTRLWAWLRYARTSIAPTANPIPRRLIAHVAAALLILCGLVTAVSTALPAPSGTNTPGTILCAAATIVLGIMTWRLSRVGRSPRRIIEYTGTEHGLQHQTHHDVALDQDNTERLALVGDLRQALTTNELHLHYQPKVALDSGTVVGVEALARWHHPRLGVVPPDRFIPLAEQTGLIAPLTDLILDQAMRQSRAWSEQGRDLEIAVNLSMWSLRDPTLAHTVAGVLARHDVPGEKLCLELTESAIMADVESSLKGLSGLRDLGVRLAIDDFGTGYSSLSYLARLPVDELKIDRSFVIDLATHESNATIVASTIGLGHSLGLTVVVEGVEDHDTLALLQRLACDVAQGYYLSRPLPANALEDWLLHYTTLDGVGASAAS